MRNPLNHPRVLRAIAALFLVLVVVGVVTGLVQAIHAANTTSNAARPGVTRPR